MENRGSSCNFWTLDVSNITPLDPKRKGKKGLVSGSSPQDDTATSHKRKLISEAESASSRDTKRVARYLSTDNTPLLPSDHVINVDADHEPSNHRRYRCRSVGDISRNNTYLLFNHMHTQAARGVVPIIHNTSMHIGKGPVHQTHIQNASWRTDSAASSLPISLAPSLFKSSSPNAVHLPPIVDLTGALRVSVELPPLKYVIQDQGYTSPN